VRGVPTRRQIWKELNLTKAQQDVILRDSWNKLRKEVTDQDLAKATGPDRDAKVRALCLKRYDETFAAAGQTLTPAQIARLKQIVLQGFGVGLFDHPEIRAARKLDEAQVKRLKADYKRLEAELGAEITSGKLTRSEAYWKLNDFSFGVPEKVRESLTAEQRKKLKQLLGEPYAFNR
jgi:hypothetical protein